MNTLLKIKNYKHINSEIHLRNFAQVNYLVGKNCSGKSSILSALGHLHDGGNSKRFFTKDSIVELTIDDSSRHIYWDDSNPNFTKDRGELSLKIIILNDLVNEKGSNGVIKPIMTYQHMGSERFDFINKILTSLRIENIEAKRRDNIDLFSNQSGELFYAQSGKEINLNFIAEGIKSYISFLNHLENGFKDSRLNDVNSYSKIIVIIEQPEENLHPDLQKKIPILINDILNSQTHRGKDIFFL